MNARVITHAGGILRLHEGRLIDTRADEETELAVSSIVEVGLVVRPDFVRLAFRPEGGRATVYQITDSTVAANAFVGLLRETNAALGYYASSASEVHVRFRGGTLSLVDTTLSPITPTA